MTTMDEDTTAKLIFEALAYGVAGDAEHAAGLLIDVCSQSDANRVYGVCCGLAESGALMLRKIYGDQAPTSPDDGMWVMQELPSSEGAVDAPHRFSVRFLIAWANGDHETTLALYNAAVHASDDEYTESVCALFTNVVGIMRLALDQQEQVNS